MLHPAVACMESAQQLHGFFQVRQAMGVANPGIFQIFRDFISIFRIQIHHRVAKLLIGNLLINSCFLPAINHPVRTFPGNAHYVR